LKEKFNEVMYEMGETWIIDLTYPEAVDKVIKLNGNLRSTWKEYYKIGVAQFPDKCSQFVGIYFVDEFEDDE